MHFERKNVMKMKLLNSFAILPRCLRVLLCRRHSIRIVESFFHDLFLCLCTHEQGNVPRRHSRAHLASCPALQARALIRRNGADAEPIHRAALRRHRHGLRREASCVHRQIPALEANSEANDDAPTRQRSCKDRVAQLVECFAAR